MSKISPGIVLVSKYTSGNSSSFKNYINYINREEAVRTKNFKSFNINKFDGYNNYMENPEKSNGLFTKDKSELTKDEKIQLQNLFAIAQKNDSIMWQDVISFNNEWLEKNGLYNSNTRIVNEGAIQDSIRKGMDLVLKEEGMSQSGVWSASIHFNTDNIHVHVALVEPYPTREYKVFKDKDTGNDVKARAGSRSIKTLDKFKSKVANSLLERDKELTKISNLIHEKIAPKNVKLKPSLDIKMLKVYNEIYKNLPNDTRLWKYNNNALMHLRPEINSVIDMYLKSNHSKDFKELDKTLVEEMKFREDVYGTGDKNYKRYEDYRTNKHHELYSKLANAMLREMKEIKKEQTQNNNYNKDLENIITKIENQEGNYTIDNQNNNFSEKIVDSNNTEYTTKSEGQNTTENSNSEKNNGNSYNQNQFEKGLFLINKIHVNKIKKAFDTDYQSTKNKQKHKQLQHEIELS